MRVSIAFFDMLNSSLTIWWRTALEDWPMYNIALFAEENTPLRAEGRKSSSSPSSRLTSPSKELESKGDKL